MIKSELIERIASQNPHLYQRDVENIVNAIIDEIIKALGRGDRVELRGFGAFSPKFRSARKGRNPKTGVEVQVAQKVIPFFKTGKEASGYCCKNLQTTPHRQIHPSFATQSTPKRTSADVIEMLASCYKGTSAAFPHSLMKSAN